MFGPVQRVREYPGYRESTPGTGRNIYSISHRHSIMTSRTHAAGERDVRLRRVRS